VGIPVTKRHDDYIFVPAPTSGHFGQLNGLLPTRHIALAHGWCQVPTNLQKTSPRRLLDFIIVVELWRTGKYLKRLECVAGRGESLKVHKRRDKARKDLPTGPSPVGDDPRAKGERKGVDLSPHRPNDVPRPQTVSIGVANRHLHPLDHHALANGNRIDILSNSSVTSGP